MMRPEATDDETRITELTIAPDGRVFAFGTSRPILELLEALQPRDTRVRRLLERAKQAQSAEAEAGVTVARRSCQ
jgi:hypothetical protein